MTSEEPIMSPDAVSGATVRGAVMDTTSQPSSDADDPDGFDETDPNGLDAQSSAPPRKPAAPKSHFARSAREWGLVVIIAVAAAVLMKLFVVQQFYVSGQSMDYTLHNYDRVLVNKLSYDLHDPNRGDVVVLEQEQGLTQRDLIKRVIGLPGEKIEMKSCVVYINDRVLVEPYLDPTVVTPNNCGGDFGPVTVPKHHVFVMGDNRPNSGDSRQSLGPVDYDQIVGRAFVVIWPKSDWRWL